MRHQTLQLIEDFLSAKTAGGRRAKSLERFRSQLARYAAMYQLLPLDPTQVERFLTSILGEPETRDTYYRTLSSFYGWLIRRKKIKENPIELVESPKLRPKVPRILDPAELVRLLTCPGHSDRDRALLYFLTDSGARIGEAALLTVDDLKDGYVLLRGKDGERFAPLSPAVRMMLIGLHLGAPSPHMWQGRFGPLTQGALVHATIAAFRRAGFIGKRYSAHALRHTFGTMWEGDEIILQHIFGHAKLDMVKRYRQFRLHRAREQHAIHSPLAQLQLPLNLEA